MENPQKETLEVVAEIGSTAVSHAFKKPPEAIYVKPQGGKITLSMHKAYNVLLARAASCGLDQDTYEVSLSELGGDINFGGGSHNTDALKTMLRKLTATLVEWDIVGKDRTGEWGVSSMLAGAIISRGKLEYSFAPQIKAKLLDPRVFARIDLRLMEKFRTRAGLALYEACYRYINNPGGLTIRLQWQEWRDMLCEGRGASEWRYFHRDTLKPALSEVNANIPDMEVAPILFHGPNGRISDLQFRITRKAQSGLALEGVMDVSPNPDLLKRLAELGMSEKDARNLFLEYEEDEISTALNVTEARLSRSNLKPLDNAVAFYMKAIKDGYKLPPAKVKQLAKQAEKSDEEAKIKSTSAAASKSWAKYEAMSEDDRQSLIERFHQDIVLLDSVLLAEFEKKGVSSAIVRGNFRNWLMSNLV